MAVRRYNRTAREAAAEQTRARIARAAAELHAEHGALGTSHAMIAARAGVSLPTVYKYFPTANDVIPHCTGLVLSEAPVTLDASVFEGVEDVPGRLRALARRTAQLYAYLAPWLRWTARDAVELPALQAMAEEMARGREALVRAALAPTWPGRPPRRLVALAMALLDFPAWQTLTGSGFTSAGAATAVGDALVTLATEHPQEDL